MKIFLICSKAFYDRIPSIQEELQRVGHIITLPNFHDAPETEKKMHQKGKAEHSRWKASMIQKSERIIEKNDAVLVLNYEKNGVENYIGGATFIEMYDAFRLHKKIFILNEIPEGILKDEISGFSPEVLNGDLKGIPSV